jgi:hypothetical protein
MTLLGRVRNEIDLWTLSLLAPVPGSRVKRRWPWLLAAFDDGLRRDVDGRFNRARWLWIREARP